MAKQKLTGAILAGVLLVGLVAGGFWLLQRRAPEVCNICQREIHAQSRAVMEANGKREPVCCVRCALTLARQRGKSVKLVEVTDYLTERALRPEDAFYVEGSRIVLCEKHEPVMDPTKQAMERVFDRCVPSLYAFSSRADAEEFTRQNGGAVLTAAQVLQEDRPQP
jgi:hypothetical protein